MTSRPRVRERPRGGASRRGAGPWSAWGVCPGLPPSAPSPPKIFPPKIPPRARAPRPRRLRVTPRPLHNAQGPPSGPPNSQSPPQSPANPHPTNPSPHKPQSYKPLTPQTPILQTLTQNSRARSPIPTLPSPRHLVHGPSSPPVPPGGPVPLGEYLGPARWHPAPFAPRHAECAAAPGGPGPRPGRW